MDCMLPHNNNSLPLAVTRTLVQLAIPLIMLIAFCTAWTAAYIYLQRFRPSDNRGKEWLSKRLTLTCYSVLGYFYPSLTQAALGVFACYPIDHPIPSGTLYPTFLKVRCMHPKLYDSYVQRRSALQSQYTSLLFDTTVIVDNHRPVLLHQHLTMNSDQHSLMALSANSASHVIVNWWLVLPQAYAHSLCQINKSSDDRTMLMLSGNLASRILGVRHATCML